MKFRILIIISTFFTLLPYNVSAESATIDFLRSTGKIYSVIVIIVVILLGIGYFLFKMDRKITELEKQIKDE